MRRERSTVETPNTGPTEADMQSTVHNLPRHKHAAVTVFNKPSSSLLHCHTDTLTNHVETDKNNSAAHHYLGTSNRQPDKQELLCIETSIKQPSIDVPFPSKSVTDLPPLYWQSSPNQSQSHLLPVSNKIINPLLLPNNSPIFTTHTKIDVPTKQKTRKDLISTRTHPSNKPTRSGPILTQICPSPNPINPSNSLTRTDPDPTMPNPTRDSAMDMETNTERKRRREEKTQADNNDEVSTQHFLSAGPGSQDCREQ
ncbi:hypothetical protein P8452_74499 [Trifolium repens]|nr:hypothetical protein P8452_74499 [Trifolium repens]